MPSSFPTNGLVCPYCLAIMHAMHQGKVPIDVCVACGTRWFDRTELAAVVNEAAPGTVLGWGEKEDKEDVHHTCPRCKAPSLVPYRFGVAGFRRCSNCKGVAIASEDLDKLLKSAGGPGSGLVAVVKELFGA